MANIQKGTAEAVLAIFRTLCTIPHGSGNTKAISDFCVRFAKECGLRVIQESCNNVIIFKDASAGYEDHPPVMLQGHLDMVCEKDADCPLDMEKDGLQLCEDGDFLYAKGTTLGGDDGFAVACALALAECDTLQHPPVEIVLTIDEETGMDGACALDPAPLRARTVLNLDSEEEGVLTAGCAGGCTAELDWNADRTMADGTAWRITLSGLNGGHSGIDIHKGNENADILLVRVLQRLGALRVVQLNGGTKSNAIPRSAEAIVVCAENVNVPQVIAQAEAEYRTAYGQTEPNLSLTAEQIANDAPAFDAEVSAQMVQMLATQPNGVQKMSAEIEGLVQTSLNLGILWSNENHVHAVMSLRSSVETEKAALQQALADMATQYGAQIEFSGEYPAWEYNPVSRVRDTVVRSYETLFGQKPRVEVIHAGLECGLLSAKLPGMDAISFGPNLYDIHTSRERMSLSSAARTWALLIHVLEHL